MVGPSNQRLKDTVKYPGTEVGSTNGEAIDVERVATDPTRECLNQQCMNFWIVHIFSAVYYGNINYQQRHDRRLLQISPTVHCPIVVS